MSGLASNKTARTSLNEDGNTRRSPILDPRTMLCVATDRQGVFAAAGGGNATGKPTLAFLVASFTTAERASAYENRLRSGGLPVDVPLTRVVLEHDLVVADRLHVLGQERDLPPPTWCVDE